MRRRQQAKRHEMGMSDRVYMASVGGFFICCGKGYQSRHSNVIIRRAASASST